MPGRFDEGAGHGEGAPPAPKGNVLTQQMGPLPVWGWATVALIAVFLYRRMTGSSGSSSSTTDPNAATLLGSTGGSVGGVFLIPQNTSGPATPAPAAAPTDPYSGYAAIWSAEQQQIDQLATQFGGNGNDAGRNFLARNAAARQLGLPYVLSDPTAGPLVVNPQTGTSVSADFFNAFVNSAPLEEVQAVGTGNPTFWEQFRTGKLVPPPAAPTAPTTQAPAQAAA